MFIGSSNLSILIIFLSVDYCSAESIQQKTIEAGVKMKA